MSCDADLYYKVAKELTRNGHSVGVRHYGRGSWAVEMEGGKVINTVESYIGEAGLVATLIRQAWNEYDAGIEEK